MIHVDRPALYSLRSNEIDDRSIGDYVDKSCPGPRHEARQLRHRLLSGWPRENSNDRYFRNVSLFQVH